MTHSLTHNPLISATLLHNSLPLPQTQQPTQFSTKGASTHSVHCHCRPKNADVHLEWASNGQLLCKWGTFSDESALLVMSQHLHWSGVPASSLWTLMWGRLSGCGTCTPQRLGEEEGGEGREGEREQEGDGRSGMRKGRRREGGRKEEKIMRHIACLEWRCLNLWTITQLTPEHARVDSSVLSLAAILIPEQKRLLHQLNASLLKQLQHCLITLSGAESYLEVLPVKRQYCISFQIKLTCISGALLSPISTVYPYIYNTSGMIPTKCVYHNTLFP